MDEVMGWTRGYGWIRDEVMGWTRDVSMVGGSRLGGALSRVLFERCRLVNLRLLDKVYDGQGV
jgi:hypothetical protein